MRQYFAKIGDKEFALWMEEGTVKAVENTSGTVYSEQYSTLAGGRYLDSQAVSDTRFYFVDCTGRERLAGIGRGFPIREGHQVKVLYCAPKGEEDGFPIAVRNSTLSRQDHVDGKAFNDRYKAIRTTWLDARLGLGCLTTIALLIATFAAPLYLKKDIYFQYFGIGLLAVLSYMAYETFIGTRIWSWRRMRQLTKDLDSAVSKSLPG